MTREEIRKERDEEYKKLSASIIWDAETNDCQAQAIISLTKRYIYTDVSFVVRNHHDEVLVQVSNDDFYFIGVRGGIEKV